MSWRDELRPASFRDVPFGVLKATREQKLNADQHNFPNRSSASSSVRVDHLGVGEQRFSVEAYVVGEDYDERRDALEQALEEQRPGRLVHPYRGERTVSVVGSIQTTESAAEGGYASIRFTVVIVSDTGLRSRVDTASIADRDLDAFLAAQAADFDTSYVTNGVPAVYQESSRGYFDKAADALKTAHGGISQGLGVVSDYAGLVTDFAASIEAFASLPHEAARAFRQAAELIAGLPGQVASSLERSLDSLLRAGDEILRGFDALTSFGRGAPYIPPTTPNALAEIRLRSAVIRHTRAVGVASAARALIAVPYSSRAHALGVRDVIASAFEDIASDVDGAGGTSVSGALVYSGLVTARVAVSRHLDAVAAELPEVRAFAVLAERPALTIAWELYGDATREPEIMTRNPVPHPGAVATGMELEVLRD